MDELQYKMLESLAKGATEGTIKAGSELAKDAAVATWTKLKSVFSWKTDPKPEEVRTLATKALADNPQLAKQVETILSDYSKHVNISTGGTAGGDYFDNRGATFNINGGAKFGGG